MDDDDQAAVHVRDERDGAVGIGPQAKVRERRCRIIYRLGMLDREVGEVDRRARQK